MTEKFENPLIKKMQRIIQGTTIRLPSRGMFYKHDELDPDITNGEIVINPMTTLDELIIRNPDMLFQGSAIDKVISRCAPQVRKPLDLFSKDIDYILVMLRKISYGDDIIINFQCPTCLSKANENEEVEEHEYNLSVNYFVQKSKELDNNDLKKYSITLTNGMVIHLRPSKYDEMIKMHQIDDATKTPEEIEEIIMLSILAVIDDVDGESDRECIKGWLKFLPVNVMEEIVSKIADANNWGPEFQYTITCKDCQAKHDISYILNPVSFFTLPSSPKTKKN